MRPKVNIRREGRGITLEIDGFSIGLDNPISRINLVSHAHLDHLKGIQNSRMVVATDETIEIAARRGYRIRRYERIKIGETKDFGGIKVTSLNAGHSLGSSQFLIEKKGLRILYTGDFNAEDSIAYKGAKPVNCDIMIADGTYGNPIYVFPKRRILYEAMIRESVKCINLGEIPLFKAYSLGKAQEAILILQKLKYPVIVGNYTTSLINEVYRKYGYDIRAYNLKDVSLTMIKEGTIFVASDKNSFGRNLKKMLGYEAKKFLGKIREIFLSGWTILSGNGIPLSGHCGYDRLLNYIKKASPSEVYFFSYDRGSEVFLSKDLKEMGIRSKFL
ncbi:MAG: MBL fold metallo-hydrolase [Candidatus Asgardarchaeia archaeon]